MILKRVKANPNQPAMVTTYLPDQPKMTARYQAAQTIGNRRLTCIGDQVLTSR